jgi:hypothetical protein
VRFTGNGRIESENDAAERALRAMVIRRKSFLHLGSSAGGDTLRRRASAEMRRQNLRMRIKLIEDLPMASSAELYQLSWVIEQLLADPRRIVQARAELHAGQQVQFLNWDDGKMRAARVVAMKDRRVTVLDEDSHSHFNVPYAAIVASQSTVTETGPGASAPSKPAPPPEIAGRGDFRVGNRVTFTDQNLQHRVGLIVRINQRTATLDCDGQTWRVAFGLLRPLIDV